MRNGPAPNIFYDLGAFNTKAVPQIRIGKTAVQRIGECLWVTVHQEAGFVIDQRLPDTAFPYADRRCSAGHCFQRREADRLQIQYGAINPYSVVAHHKLILVDRRYGQNDIRSSSASMRVSTYLSPAFSLYPVVGESAPGGMVQII